MYREVQLPPFKGFIMISFDEAIPHAIVSIFTKTLLKQNVNLIIITYKKSITQCLKFMEASNVSDTMLWALLVPFQVILSGTL